MNTIEDLVKGGLCMVCKVQTADVQYLPCGHKCLCRPCSFVRELGVCPICGEIVLQKVSGDTKALSNVKNPAAYASMI